MKRIEALEKYIASNKKATDVVKRIMAWDSTKGLRANAKRLGMLKDAACSLAIKYGLKHTTKVGRPRK